MRDSIGMESTLLSHHLRAVRDAGIVTSELNGKHLVYALTDQPKDELSHNQIDLGAGQFKVSIWDSLGFRRMCACTHQTLQLVRASTAPYSKQIETLKSPGSLVLRPFPAQLTAVRQ